MTTRQIQKIFSEAISDLEGWQICDRFAYVSEPDDILRGIFLEGSSFSSSVLFVWAFAMPLYVPAGTVYFNLGIRLKDSNCSERWSVDFQNHESFVRDLLDVIRKDGMPWLQQFADPERIIKFEQSLPKAKASNLHHQEVLAFSHTYIGDIQAALTSLSAVVTRGDESTSPWAKPISERAEYLLGLLREGPKAAQAQLSKWIDETRKTLKLPTRNREG